MSLSQSSLIRAPRRIPGMRSIALIRSTVYSIASVAWRMHNCTQPFHNKKCTVVLFVWSMHDRHSVNGCWDPLQSNVFESFKLQQGRTQEVVGIDAGLLKTI